MKVILLKEIPTLGRAGDVKGVADGYARNFLIPRKLAEPATEENIKTLGRRAVEMTRNEERERAEFQALAGKLHAAELRFALKVGGKGRAFGSITAQDVAEKLAERGIKIEKDWIELKQGIKTAGEHGVKIKFPHQIEGEIKVVIEAEKSENPES